VSEIESGESGANASAPNPSPESSVAANTADQLQLLVENIHEYAIFVLDTEGNIATWNASAQRLKGYTAEEVVGQHFSILYGPDDVASRKPWRELEIVRDAGRLEDEGWRFRKDGTRFWANVVITALRDSTGALRGFGKVTRDMTDRRLARLIEQQYLEERAHAQAEAVFAERARKVMETLRESEAQFRLLLNSTAEGIYGLDTAGVCTFCNPAAARLLGYAGPEFLIGKRLHPLIHHSYHDGHPYPMEQCRIHGAFVGGEGQHVVDEVFWRSDETSFPVEYWSYPVRKGDTVVGSVVTFVDITERRRAEEELREKEARFRQLTEASFDGVILSERGVVIEVNPGFAEMFGYEQPEVIGRSVIDFVAEESLAAARERIAKNMEGRYEVIGKRKDGGKIILEAAGKTHVAANRITRITALRDVTHQRALEERFRQSQKMEAIGRLAGGVAHDFNNLLTVILSYTDMMLQDRPEDDSSREDLIQIREASIVAASLTRQLLAFSRQQVIEPKLLDLNDVLARSGKMLQRLIGEDIELIVIPAPHPVVVRVDAGQIDQVIMNLAVNARDSMPKGGCLTIEIAQMEMDSAYAREHWPAKPGLYGLLTVTDTGTGMDAETRARIFEPFFTTKESGKGTGLGLATVYGIVKQSNGFIWLYSEPGHGTTFKIYLPLIGGSAERYEQPGHAPSPRGSETILVVEDSAAVRAAAKKILEQYGYLVLEAPTPRAALDIASKHIAPIHLLLTDVVMPEMSGRELAEEITRIRKNVRVLYMSGYTDDAILRHGMLHAGAAYLQKPFSGETLAKKVRQVLDQNDSTK
jgi:two-component system cell cycle sensor histidine kinase/response regulator CckA